MKAYLYIQAECPKCGMVMMRSRDHTVYCSNATCEHYMLEYTIPQVELMPLKEYEDRIDAAYSTACIATCKAIGDITTYLDGCNLTITQNRRPDDGIEPEETRPVIPARLAPLASLLTNTV